jgi:phosphate/sulfate permease
MNTTAEDTSDITRAILSVTLLSEVVTGAFDTSLFDVTVVLCVAVALAVGALTYVPFVLRRFEFYFTLLEVFDGPCWWRQASNPQRT